MGSVGFDGSPGRSCVQGASGAPSKSADVDESSSQGNSTSIRCRFCGSDERAADSDDVREHEQYQVVVACGSCGHAFAAISRN